MNCRGAGGEDRNPRSREISYDISTMGFLNYELLSCWERTVAYTTEEAEEMEGSGDIQDFHSLLYSFIQ